MTVEDKGDFERMNPSGKDSDSTHGSDERRRRMELARTLEAPSPTSSKAREAVADGRQPALTRRKVNPLARTVPLAQIAPDLADPPVGEGTEHQPRADSAAPKRNDQT